MHIYPLLGIPILDPNWEPTLHFSSLGNTFIIFIHCE